MTGLPFNMAVKEKGTSLEKCMQASSKVSDTSGIAPANCENKKHSSNSNG